MAKIKIYYKLLVLIINAIKEAYKTWKIENLR